MYKNMEILFLNMTLIYFLRFTVGHRICHTFEK